jgi:RNA polymerase sigma-70 factor (ECF subfamily)
MTPEQFKNDILPWSRKLYPLVKRLLKSDADVQDALQDVMLKLWDKRQKLAQFEKPEAYVLALCRNHCLDMLKKKRPRPMEEGQTYELSNLPHEGANMDVLEKLAIVRQVMEKLPEKYREVIQYREIDGFDFEEIKLMTGFEVPHLRVILSRARLKLKEEISKIYDYEKGENKHIVGGIL